MRVMMVVSVTRKSCLFCDSSVSRLRRLCAETHGAHMLRLGSKGFCSILSEVTVGTHWPRVSEAVDLGGRFVIVMASAYLRCASCVHMFLTERLPRSHRSIFTRAHRIMVAVLSDTHFCGEKQGTTRVAGRPSGVGGGAD